MDPFVVVGEALVDVVVAPDGPPTYAAGGSPANVAVGLARLGIPTQLLTRLGDDEPGRRVLDHLTGSGVGLHPSSVTSGFSTSTATAYLGPDGAATYDFDVSWDLPALGLPDGRALHVGSLGALLTPGAAAVRDLAEQARSGGRFVSYDPNIRPAFVTDRAALAAQVAELAALATVVKLSEEDAAVLYPDASPRETGRALLAGDATELVVVTRGGAGAIAVTEGQVVEVPAPPVDVADTVGAGDSFMAAFLAVCDEWGLVAAPAGRLAAITEQDLATLLHAAMAAAAVTCSRRGANPPTRRELPTGWPAPRRW